MLKISNKKPPVWDRLVAHFGPSVRWGKTCVTYGDTCYAGFPLTPDLEVHELVHVMQQSNPEAWWDRYLADPAFRLDQELAAYRQQYKFAKTILNNRNTLFKLRDKIARDLASPMYGNIISYADAFKEIAR